MSPQMIAWMSAVQGLILIAPDVIRFSAKVKDWIADLFSAGVISVEQQNELYARVNEICRATLSGQLPDHWKVDPDPS